LIVTLKPLISVILPVYNGEAFIYQAIESVLNQTFSDFELIIINDGSTDKSAEIILSFHDERIKYIENESNLKLIQTLNKGLDFSTGKYIARMDADDVCHPQRFEKQVEFLSTHPNYILCGTWAKIINNSNEITGRIKRIDRHELLKANLLFTTPFIHPSVMFNAELLKNERYSATALHCEDLELWLRLASNTNNHFATIPEYLLSYRWHTTNISVENSEFQKNERKKIISPFVRKMLKFHDDFNEEIHFALFDPATNFSSKVQRHQLRMWINALLRANVKANYCSDLDLRTLLLSRWIILCIRSKSYRHLFGSGISFMNVPLLLKLIRVLRFK